MGKPITGLQKQGTLANTDPPLTSSNSISLDNSITDNSSSSEEKNRSNHTKIPPRRTRSDLLAALGLDASHDPLKHRVTEQELNLDFGQLYVETESAPLALFRDLEHHTFLFATPGMGKSATRLAVEYDLRTRLDSEAVLCVRYTQSYSILNQPTLEDIHDNLCREIAIDSVIQTFERRQWDESVLHNEVFLNALSYQAQRLPSQLRASKLQQIYFNAIDMYTSLYDEHYESEFTQSRENPTKKQHKAPKKSSNETIQGMELHNEEYEYFWSQDLRPDATGIALNKRWLELMQKIISSQINQNKHATYSIQESMASIKQLGFNYVVILVDALDDYTADSGAWLDFMEKLFAFVESWQQFPMILKCFLPLEIEQAFKQRYESTLKGLTLATKTSRIDQLSPVELENILRERFTATQIQPFRAAGLELLTVRDSSENIIDWLIEYAKGSPRRLIEYASRLLDFHVQHGFQDHGRLSLTKHEWFMFRASLHAT